MLLNHKDNYVSIGYMFGGLFLRIFLTSGLLTGPRRALQYSISFLIVGNIVLPIINMYRKWAIMSWRIVKF
jgi:hypothetical protein